LNAIGFQYDRVFMLIDANNKFVSQRTYPKMALIATQIDTNLATLTVSAPGVPTDLTFPLDIQIGDERGVFAATPIEVTVWGDVCQAYEVVTAGPWFSKVLQLDGLRLVRISPDFKRNTDPRYAPNGQTAFSDGYPFLIASQESIDDLNSKLSKPIAMINFRPNIVCRSGGVAFAEDTWRDIIFQSPGSGTVIPMSVVKPCSRCKVPTNDPVTGILDPENQPTRAMQNFRSGSALGLENPKWRKEVFFGQNLDHGSRGEGQISVGDTVRVLTRQ
jgi:uncharacterized protein